VTHKYLVVYTTFPDLRTAKEVITGLVSARLAACGNIFKLSSIYRWQGKVEKTPEYGVLIKTRRQKYRAVEKYIKKNHPYDVPEIVAWNIDQGEENYLDWITKTTN